MKCFWCFRLFEDGQIPREEIADADFIFNGESICERDLIAIRRVGAGRLLDGKR